MSELTIESLRAARDLLAKVPATVYAIWIVDRPGVYTRLVALMATQQEHAVASLVLALFGTKLYDWSSEGASAEDWARVPAFCRTPGVYLRWTDGRDERVEVQL